MGQLQVAVADCDPAIRQSMRAVLQKDEQFVFVGGAGDGVEAYQLIREKEPDVAIVDMVMPGIDGFTLIEQIKKDKTIRKEPRFILTTSAHNEQIMAAAFQMGVSYFLLKPYDPQMLANRVKQLTGIESNFTAKKQVYSERVYPTRSENLTIDRDLDTEIKEMLHLMGIPVHLRGYRYLITAIKAAVNDEEMLEGVTKILYPHVAKEHDSLAGRVERGMRHAIEAAWEREGSSLREKLFANTVMKKGKPTNSEFIAMIASYLHRR